MTPERFGELLRRPQLLDGQNATELEELISDYPWCGPLRLLRYRKAVLTDGTDVAKWRARAGVFLAHAAVATGERALRAENPARATTHFDFAGGADVAPQPPPVPRAEHLDEATTQRDLLHICTLTGAIGVDTAEWYLHRNGLIMEFGRPRPTPIENLASYKRWKRRRVRTSWNDLLMLGIEAPRKKKAKKSSARRSGVPTVKPEVASETLADLLAGQGHTERAVDMYEQLRLRYPEKEASFASRIAALRQQEA